jgi:MOSC domain-containing protein YiiM
VVAALIAEHADTLLSARRREVGVSLEGFEGDKHSGMTRHADARTPEYPRGTPIRNDRQVSIVSEHELMGIASAMELPELRAEWIGANLLLGGIPRLTSLPPSTRLVFPRQAVLVVQHENLPCRWPGELMAKTLDRPGFESLFPKAALHRRGVVACVERAGWIAEGERVSVEVPAHWLYAPEQA